MPGLGRYPCSSCHYVAGNRRMLARHAVLIHSEKVFKCPLCPFITRYAANWYRHKRDLHGLTKITTCEACGFFANSTAELAQHKEAEHSEQLQLEKYEDKYAKEKARLGASKEESTSPEVTIIEDDVKFQSNNVDIYDINNVIEEVKTSSGEPSKDDSITFSLPVNGFLDNNVVEVKSSTKTEEGSSEGLAMSGANASSNSLRPLKVRRSYSCNECGLLTSNPREYLYHLRNIHGDKITVHECKYCIYASKHIQKLQRHCNLVHRQLIAKDPEFRKQLQASKEKKTKPEMISIGLPLSANASATSDSVKNLSSNLPKPAVRDRFSSLLKCSACSYQTRNKGFLIHHEKTVHLKKRFYRCLKCGYVTNERGRYTKHIKYHNLPKMQCEYCFFKTTYKWNMERHMKNHEDGAEGEFRCSECNFTTSTKQSFKVHVTNHHDMSAEDLIEEDGDDANGQTQSTEWEDIEIVEGNEEDGIEVLDDNVSYESNDFPEVRETPETVWKDGKVYQKSLKCRSCDFKAAWPFELKKHEETHRSQKKHPCPLCGMRFEHIAWLTKHLRRVHRENTQAKNIAAAFELLKPARRRPGKEYAADSVLPMFQEVLKQNSVGNNKPPESNKNSMLSSLLKKPLQPFMPTTVSKFNTSYKPKVFGASSSMSRQLRISNYYDKMPSVDSSESLNSKSKSVPTCSVCGYKTRWISELQRHMRVHSQEKPFRCHKCKYHCKWKGDLNRHLMKYHGIKVPSSGKRHGIPKLKLKKSSDALDLPNDWQAVDQEAKRNQFSTSTPLRNDQDSPLDLTLSKDSFSNPSNEDIYDFDKYNALDSNEAVIDVETIEDETGSTPISLASFKSSLSYSRESPVPEDSGSNVAVKRKYQCPFCTFGTTTASRFHVHVVQHYNRRPFMCSVCGYNSNWEWDITKHIRLKGCRDKSHNKACVLLTDETGRRNYEKYDKYLVDIDQPKSPTVSSRPDVDVDNISEVETRYNTNKASFSEQPAKTCSYDFRNIGSNFEDAPVNIVVTPDINIPDGPDIMENSNDILSDKQFGMFDEVVEKGGETKCFFCKHCNFKHSTKRVVVSHLSVHAGLKPFRCRACGLTSNWRHVIVRHVKDAHNGYMNEVEDRISFVQEGYALRLTSINSGNKEAGASETPHLPQFGCKICPYKCDKEFYIKFHMKQHRPREGAVYRCDFCPYFVKFKKTLVRHMKLHNPPSVENKGVNESTEFMNSDSYAPENQLQMNVYQNDVYEFYDPQLNDSADDSIPISFDTLNQYSSSTEQTSPQKVKRHICECCPYKTDNKTQYLYHKQFHRPNPSAPFKCSICTYWATMQHLLTQHMRVHTESDAEPEKPSRRNKYHKLTPPEPQEIDTDIPDKMSIVYVKRGDLIVKMFKCKFCPMMNKKKANVRVHQKMHGVIVNNGRFACTYCNYQCLNQGGLTNHIKIHQKVPEKSYTDENATDLEGHRRKSTDNNADDSTHLPRKKVFSYFCMKCPALFKSASDLQIHTKFHGSLLPFPCDFCDYRARHKPHLFKHLTVHTPEYESKRNASLGPPVNSESEVSFSESAEAKNVSGAKKVDQMLLLEASEVKANLGKTGEAASNLQKCVFCPASFFKTSTLSYHISLHGSEGEYKCSQCDYAVNRSSNLSVHNHVHPRKTPVKPVKRPLRSWPCTKCPAIFYKQDRFDRHISLHGKNYKFVCEQCDYSVRFAANLIKHKRVHVPKSDAENADSSPKITAGGNAFVSASQAMKPLAENSNIQEIEEKKVTFICDRCPYFQCRKDAVQSHQRRHWMKDGFKCPYCDYSSMQNGFLQSHIKMHIQPHQLFPAQAFMKYESFKIICKEDENEVLLFDDEEMQNDGFEDQYTDSEVSEKLITAEVPKPPKRRKISVESSREEDSFMCTSSTDSLIKPKVPVVVLSDIFANEKDFRKYAPKLKIPKLRITKCTSSSGKEFSKLNLSDTFMNCQEKPQSDNSKNPSKPSIVVKIKVENCVVNMHEKTMYSVSTKQSETSEPLKTVENGTESTENTIDSTSDLIFRDSDPSLHTVASISPVPEDVEECTLTSNSGIDDSMKVSDESVGVEDIMDSIAGPGTDTEELIISQPANEICDLKSDESFSNDTVPVAVSDILCDKLGSLNELHFKEDLSLTNGVSANHLANGLGLLSEEIKVGTIN